MSEEPIRWLEDPNVAASLRADLAHSATATVQGLDLSVGLAGLRTAITAQTGSLAPAATGSSFGLKSVVGVLVLGGGLGLWKVTSTDDEATARVAAAAIEVVDDAQEPAPSPLPTPPESRVLPVIPPAVASEAPSAVVEKDAPASTPEATVSPSKRDDKTERRSTARVEEPAVAPVTSDPPPDDRYLQEATMVARARKSLSTDPSRTLALTEEIAREFPSGQLVEERRALEIRALAKLGRMDDAKERAAAFLADHAKGPHASAVRRAIGQSADP